MSRTASTRPRIATPIARPIWQPIVSSIYSAAGMSPSDTVLQIPHDATGQNIVNLGSVGGVLAFAAAPGTTVGPFGRTGLTLSAGNYAVLDAVAERIAATAPESFTLCAWLRYSAFVAFPALFAFLNPAPTATATILVWYVNDNQNGNGVRLYSRGGTPINENNAPNDRLNVWQHYAISYAGDTFTFYIDGQVVFTNLNANRGVPVEATRFRLGAYDPPTSAQPYTGDLYDPRVYAKVLTPQEILAIMAEAENVPQNDAGIYVPEYGPEYE